MLHRSYSLLSFIRRNISCHCTDRFYVFRVGVTRRHTSIFITPKYVHVISNTQKPFSNASPGKIGEMRWIHASASRLAKKKIEEKKIEKIGKDAESPLQQKVVELDQENLGKVKERPLEVKFKSSQVQSKEEEKPGESKNEEKKNVEKEETPVAKKGNAFCFAHFCKLFWFTL